MISPTLAPPLARHSLSLSHCLPRAHHCCPVIRVAVDDNSVQVVVVCVMIWL